MKYVDFLGAELFVRNLNCICSCLFFLSWIGSRACNRGCSGYHEMHIVSSKVKWL